MKEIYGNTINVLVIVRGKRKFDFNGGPESCFFGE